MKSMILVALAFVAVAAAAPVEDSDAQTLQEVNEKKPNGDYNFGYETDNGINRKEEGQVVSVPDEENKPHEVVVVRGSYSYPREDGTLETINYQADQDGYRADGPSIPKVESS